MANIFEIKNLSFSYSNKDIFNNLNINIEDGKITTLLGQNGCGKSTLLKILAKNITYSKGNIIFDNKELNSYSAKELAKKLSMVYQKNTIPEEITVYNMVSFARLPYQNILFYKNSEDDRKKVEFALEQTDLLDLKETLVSELSGGQLQRVYIAMCLAQDTKTLILDEPTTFLDIKYQKSILELIKKLNKDFNLTIIMVLHDINQSLNYSDNIIALKNGEVIAKGQNSQFYNEQLLSNIYDTTIKIENNHVISW